MFLSRAFFMCVRFPWCWNLATPLSMLNDMLIRACIRSGTPSAKEPTGLFPSDEKLKRPDGVTLVPYGKPEDASPGMSLAPTLAVSHRPLTSILYHCCRRRTSGPAEAYYQICSLFRDEGGLYDFVPVAIETLGPINNEGAWPFWPIWVIALLQSPAAQENPHIILISEVSVCMQRTCKRHCFPWQKGVRCVMCRKVCDGVRWFLVCRWTGRLYNDYIGGPHESHETMSRCKFFYPQGIISTWVEEKKLHTFVTPFA